TGCGQHHCRHDSGRSSSIDRSTGQVDKDELRHTLGIRFNLSIVGDKLTWVNTQRKKEGYKLENGSRIKEILLKKNNQGVRKTAHG
ncbi:MAG: hypothetical protein QGH73_18645, partial [Rhodospirillales bacterium]|nr:hypothetical protein [Rhodospirillales bacterium]